MAIPNACLTPTSVPDMARSLRLARERAELTVAEAAARAGLGNAVVEDLESGNVVQQQDRIATLRSLRSYADSLGLPGSDYVLVAVEQWPSIAPVLSTGHETAVVPVVPSGGVRQRRGGSGSRSGKGWAVSISTLVGIAFAFTKVTATEGASRLQKGGSVPAGSGRLAVRRPRTYYLGSPRLAVTVLRRSQGQATSTRVTASVSRTATPPCARRGPHDGGISRVS